MTHNDRIPNSDYCQSSTAAQLLHHNLLGSKFPFFLQNRERGGEEEERRGEREGGKEREREGERERGGGGRVGERERERGGPTDRDKDRQTDKQTDGQGVDFLFVFY